MFESLEQCISAWASAGNHGDIPARIERNARWIPYYSFLAQTREEAEAAIDPHAAKITDELFARGLLHAGDTVLDIGAGTGGFAHAFAARGLHVTALEMDEASLSVCRAQAEQMELANLQYEHQMWETFVPKQPFDFVFTSMCPAICNYDELMRMESYATSACGIIAVTRGSYDLRRKQLLELLQVRPQAGMTTEAIWYDEALYLSGRRPDVLNWSRFLESEIPVEEAIDRNARYFEIFGISQSVSRPILADYFNDVSNHGMVRDETRLNTALISWRIEQPE
jgi:SAM-dependent methyltransferase